MNAMIRDVAELMRIDARMAQAEMVLDLTEPLPPVVGDRIQLEQVLVNLMCNGFESLRESDRTASSADHPHGVRQPRQGSSSRCMTTALGIRRRHARSPLRAILHHKTRRNGHGAVDQPVDHRESWREAVGHARRRRGAVFHFTLPMDRENITVETEPTIFIVDDDPAVRQSLTVLVRSMHLQAETFESAQQFLDAFDPTRPGCLLLDVRMPGISGLELLEQFNREEMPLPAIVMSAYGDVPMVVRAMKAGALNFLEKPCRDQQLWEAIQEALKWDGLHRQHVVLRSQGSPSPATPYPRRTQRPRFADRRQVEPSHRRRVGAQRADHRSPPRQAHEKNEGRIPRGTHAFDPRG